MPDAAGSPSTADVPPMWWSPVERMMFVQHFETVYDDEGNAADELPADAVRLVPVGGTAPTPKRVVTNHAPRAEWSGAWAELGGYVQAAVDSGTQIDPANLLAYMRELKSRALRPVRKWMDELMTTEADQ
jgi:hypothetical protein